MNASVYTRPNKSKFIECKQREDFELATTRIKAPKVITVDKSTECHVTPPDVCKRMVQYASPFGDVLEPEAGTGNIIQALVEYGISFDSITAVERHVSLVNVINERFDNKVRAINSCFLEYAANTDKRFDSILMNPPFRLDLKHVQAAISLLKPNGVIVFLVPSSFEEGDFELIESLSEQTFATTKVNTKILRHFK